MDKPDQPESEDLRPHPDRLMDLGLEAGRAWSDEELAAALEDQLRAPMQFDLGALPRDGAARLRRLSAEEGLIISSLQQLFGHARPPLELLSMTKDFAKSSLEAADPILPGQVARVLYYLAIAAALLHGTQRISTLNDQALRRGFEWAVRLTWLDDYSREQFSQAIKYLGKDVHG